MKDFQYEIGKLVDDYHWWIKGRRKIMIDLVSKELNMRGKRASIIDFGCGPSGNELNELGKYGDVTGADYSERAIELCREKFKGNIKQIDISKPIKWNVQYDFVIALEIMEHIEDDTIAAKNIYNALKPGGHAVITVPAYEWLWTVVDDNCMHYRRYDKKRLKRVLIDNGLEIDYIGYYMCFLFPLAMLVRLYTRWKKRDVPSSLETGIPPGIVNNLLYKIFCMESCWIKKGRTFPYGLSLIAKVHKSRLRI